jgi:hypothetical protein
VFQSRQTVSTVDKFRRFGRSRLDGNSAVRSSLTTPGRSESINRRKTERITGAGEQCIAGARCLRRMAAFSSFERRRVVLRRSQLAISNGRIRSLKELDIRSYRAQYVRSDSALFHVIFLLPILCSRMRTEVNPRDPNQTAACSHKRFHRLPAIRRKSHAKCRRCHRCPPLC